MSDIQPRLPGVPPTARPGRGDPAIMRRAAELLAPAVATWGGAKNRNLAEIVDDLAREMRPFPDGYDFAKQLEDGGGYGADFELAEILDGASF